MITKLQEEIHQEQHALAELEETLRAQMATKSTLRQKETDSYVSQG